MCTILLTCFKTLCERRSSSHDCSVQWDIRNHDWNFYSLEFLSTEVLTVTLSVLSALTVSADYMLNQCVQFKSVSGIIIKTKIFQYLLSAESALSHRLISSQR